MILYNYTIARGPIEHHLRDLLGGAGQQFLFNIGFLVSLSLEQRAGRVEFTETDH